MTFLFWGETNELAFPLRAGNGVESGLSALTGG